MAEVWFVMGLALGVIVMGFTAIGSFDRGSDSVRRRSWTLEHLARKRAFLLSRPANVGGVKPTTDEAVPRAS